MTYKDTDRYRNKRQSRGFSSLFTLRLGKDRNCEKNQFLIIRDNRKQLLKDRRKEKKEKEKRKKKERK